MQNTLSLLAERPGHEPVTEALRQALGSVRQGIPGPALIEALGASDAAEEVLAVAVYCALVSEDIRHGLRLAVNHSGPSRATGSVCGALLGALHGRPRCRRPGSRSWRGGPPSSNWPTTSRWR